MNSFGHFDNFDHSISWVADMINSNLSLSQIHNLWFKINPDSSEDFFFLIYKAGESLSVVKRKQKKTLIKRQS
jgi:hypothetical protein